MSVRPQNGGQLAKFPKCNNARPSVFPCPMQARCVMADRKGGPPPPPCWFRKGGATETLAQKNPLHRTLPFIMGFSRISASNQSKGKYGKKIQPHHTETLLSNRPAGGEVDGLDSRGRPVGDISRCAE